MPQQTQLSDARLLDLLLQVADSLEDGIIAFDLRCRYIFWNRAMERLTGRLAGEVVGRNVFEVFPALRQRGLEELLQQALAGDTTASADVPFAHSSGNGASFEATYYPYKEWGKVAGCAVIVRDLTLQQRTQNAETASATSDQRFRRLHDHSPAAVQTFAPDGRVLAVNPAFERLFGITLEQLSGYNIFHDQELIAAGLTADMQAVFRGETRDWPELLHTIDRGSLLGQTRWTRSFIYPVLENGAVREVVWCRQDITAQKQVQAALAESEARFRRAHQTAKIGAYELDLKSNQLRWFVEMPSLQGLAGDSDLNAWLRYLSVEDRGVAQQALQELLAGHGQSLEVCVRRPEGTRVWLRCGGEVVRNQAGESAHVVGVMLDITEAKLAEEVLRESEERFRFMISSLPQIAWVSGAQGEPEFYNQQWYRYAGLREDAEQPWNWTDYEHPADRPFTAAAWQQAVKMGERYEVEVRLRRAQDQSYRWHLLRALPMRDEAGRIVRWFGTATDVHELKIANDELRLSRERLRLAQEAARAGVWELALETRELTYSAEFAELIGLPVGQAASFDDLISCMSFTADQQAAAKTLQQVARSRKELRIDFRLRRNGEGTRLISLRGQVVQMQGKPVIAGIALDVTEAPAEKTAPAIVPARNKKGSKKDEQKRPAGKVFRAAAG
jgi:PAS domain S-box-containing protein